MRKPPLTDALGGIIEGLLGEDMFSVPGVRAVARGLLEIASDTGVRGAVPGLDACVERYLVARAVDRESALMDLYLKLHGAGAAYSAGERAALAGVHGCANQPGGIAPLLVAATFVRPGSRSIDLGAGNGLQGLLLQRLAPHALTVQVELSGECIRMGRLLARAMGLDGERVSWVHGDIALSPLDGVDLVYVYRPVKPHGAGLALYEGIARRLDAAAEPLTVVSVADCLGPHLGPRFDVLFESEYVTCYGAE